MPQLGTSICPASTVFYKLNGSPAGEAPPEADGPIEPLKSPSEVRQDPYPLPKEFTWSFLDINDPAQVGPIFPLSPRM